MKVVKAAAVQISSVLYSRDGTVEKVIRKIHELGEQGVGFATFPETVVRYYPYFAVVHTPYQIISGREHLQLLEQSVTVPSVCHRRNQRRLQASGSRCLDRRERTGSRNSVQHAASLRCRRCLASAAAQDLAHLSRAHNLGPRRRLMPAGG